MPTVTHGVTCPECSSRSRVIETTTRADVIQRVRMCRNPSCLQTFETLEDRMQHTHAAPDLNGHNRGLPCPQCGGSTTVQQTRRAHGQVRRLRRCTECTHTFKTKERPQR